MGDEGRRMGCAGSTEDGQGQQYQEEAAVKVKDTTAGADGPEPVEENENSKLPKPTGDQFHVLIGSHVRFSSFLQATTTVKDVQNFCNWQLTLHKDKLPKGYVLAEQVVTGLTSPHVMSDGLIFCPEDQIHELDGWDEGERYLVALNSKWNVARYNDECDVADAKREDIWTAHKSQNTGVAIEWHTDLRESDIPAEFKEKAEE